MSVRSSSEVAPTPLLTRSDASMAAMAESTNCGLTAAAARSDRAVAFGNCTYPGMDGIMARSCSTTASGVSCGVSGMVLLMTSLLQGQNG